MSQSEQRKFKLKVYKPFVLSDWWVSIRRTVCYNLRLKIHTNRHHSARVNSQEKFHEGKLHSDWSLLSFGFFVITQVSH